MIWGLWHAALIFGYRLVSRRTGALPAILRTVGGWLITVPLAMLGWLFFRADNAGAAFGMLWRAFDPMHLDVLAMRENNYLLVFLCFVGLLVTAAVLKMARLQSIPGPLRHASLSAANGVMIFSVFLHLREGWMLVVM